VSLTVHSQFLFYRQIFYSHHRFMLGFPQISWNLWLSVDMSWRHICSPDI